MKVLAVLSLLTIVSLSCKKSIEKNTACFSDVATARTITDKPAFIHFTDNQYYIKEQFTIDTRLLPCNLTDEYMVSSLLVTISGEVKNTLLNEPCCTDNFVITKISK